MLCILQVTKCNYFYQFVTDVFDSPDVGVQRFMKRKMENDHEFFHPAPHIRKYYLKIS